MQNKQEIEFKWAVQSKNDFTHFLKILKDQPVKLSQATHQRIQDFYLDTPQRLLGKSRIACRLRHSSQKCELTLKAQNELKEGLAQRVEINIPIPFLSNYTATVKYCREHILRSPFNRNELINLFKIQNRRTKRLVRISGAARAELCFDHVILVRNRKRVRMLEIELEFLGGPYKIFQAFVKKMTEAAQLKPSKQSKVKTALKHFHLKTRKVHPRQRLLIGRLVHP